MSRRHDLSMILYAPNVHSGGGLVLLRGLLGAWPAARPLRLILDTRARAALTLADGWTVSWTAPTLASRLRAEAQLRDAAGPGETVLCLHGLPPLWPVAARVVVFVQNRYHLQHPAGLPLRPRTRLRLAVERAWASRLRGRVDGYIVQTPTMARLLAAWHTDAAPATVLPFADPVVTDPGAVEWDFVFVADGEAHKNHGRLLQAWALLARDGLRPRLALTLGPRDQALIEHVARFRAETGCEIYNLGHLDHGGVLSLLTRSRALVFPSLIESFGLPLIEARQLGVAIVAGELDFVRDVCEPVQTFDPLSPVSIARAVRRYLGQPEPVLTIQPAAALWDAVSGDAAYR